MQYRDKTKNLVRDFGFSKSSYFFNDFVSTVNTDNPLEFSAGDIDINIETSRASLNAFMYLVNIEFSSSYVGTIDYNYSGYTFSVNNFRYNDKVYTPYPISASFESIRSIVSVYVNPPTRKVVIDCADTIRFRDMHMLHITCLCMTQVSNFT